MQNILVTSVSNKIPLLKSLEESICLFDKRMKIYGADIDENVLSYFFVDFFWKMPKIEELTSDYLLEYCIKNQIKYILPTRDEDVFYFSSLKKEFEEKGIYIFCSNIQSVKLCFDKYSFAKNNGMDFNIRTSLDIEALSSIEKFVVKERFGSGSKNIGINLSKNEAIVFSKNLDKPIFQEYIEGVEYSIDGYVNKDNKCIGMIIRQREIIKDGEAIVTSVIDDRFIEEKIKHFLELNQITGHSVTQIIQKDNKIFLIECNTRFGGASTLSHKMGLKSFYWFLCEVNNKEFAFHKRSNNLRQIRVPKDIYFEC